MQSFRPAFFIFAALNRFFMSDSTKISTSTAPKPVGLYPHARKVGELLFLSGVGPRTAGSDANDSGVPGLELDHNGNFKAFDFEAQVHSVFANVKAILEASGSSWDKLVDVTVFLVDMNRDFHTFNRIYAEYFKDNQPCRTTVEINSLPTPIAIELKCVATV
jgi:2-aminomuconate deaminase